MRLKKNALLQGIAIVVAAIIATCGGYMLFFGIPLWGLPDEGQIVSVSIQDIRYGTEPQVVTDRAMVSKARKLANFANYTLGAPANGEAVTTIVYKLENGQTKTLSANEATVWWQGRIYKIKDEAILVNLAEGFFFADKPE